ncbi:MAG: hypothetical protein GY913_18430 [Proteobacteria bacterium]|nr:hypothetical protein [Pseudomonadota bacterium]MCP4918887.1 hypothetical protein [Pseudomonadota bacterium]
MNDAVQDWLLGLGPHPGDEAMDEFAGVELPAGLADSTLAAVRASRQSEPLAANRPSRWKAFVVAGLAVAAATLLVVRAAPETGDVSSMTARGLDETTPEVALKMAAERDGKVDRFRDDMTYRAGDALYFRYQMASDGWVHLVHAGPTGVEVLSQSGVSRGEDDLTVSGHQVVWRLEEGDPSAVFALVSTREDIDAATLARELEDRLQAGQTVEPDDLCQAAAETGRRCDAVFVEVQP